MDRLWQNVKDATRSVTVVRTLKTLVALIVIVLITGAYGMSKALQTNKIELTKTRLINQMDNNNAINKYDYVKKKIKDDEGFKMLPYTLKYNKQHINKETKVPDFVIAVKENFHTGGYGHKILKGEKEPKEGYTRDYWEGVFEKDFEIALNGARKIIPEENLDPKAFGVLVEMVYQMGEDGVKGFKTAIKHLKNNDYNSASDQLLYNFDDNGDMKGWTNWHKQTPKRANEAAELLSSL